MTKLSISQKSPSSSFYGDMMSTYHFQDISELKSFGYDVTPEYQIYIEEQARNIQEYQKTNDEGVLHIFLLNRDNFLRDKISYESFPYVHSNIQTVLLSTQYEIMQTLDGKEKYHFSGEMIVIMLISIFGSYIVLKHIDILIEAMKKTFSKYTLENFSQEQGDFVGKKIDQEIKKSGPKLDENLLDLQNKIEVLKIWQEELFTRLRVENFTNSFVYQEKIALEKHIDDLMCGAKNYTSEIQKLLDVKNELQQKFDQYDIEKGLFLQEQQEKINQLDIFQKDGVIYQTLDIRDGKIECQEILMIDNDGKIIFSVEKMCFMITSIQEINSVESLEFDHAQKYFQTRKNPFYFQNIFTFEDIKDFYENLIFYKNQIQECENQESMKIVDVLRRILNFLGMKHIDVYNQKDFKKIISRIHPDKHSHYLDEISLKILTKISQEINHLHEIIRTEYLSYFKIESIEE